MMQNNEKNIQDTIHDLGKNYVNHFSTIKLKYKKLALAWLIAIFASLAYIISAHDQEIHFPKLYLITILTFLSVIGIKLISFLDVHVYHRQMRAIFKCLVILENQREDGIHSYTNMAKALHKKRFDPIMIDSLYYGSINLCVVLLGAVSIYIKMHLHYPKIGLYTPLAICILFLIWESIVTLLSIRSGGSRFN